MRVCVCVQMTLLLHTHAHSVCVCVCANDIAAAHTNDIAAAHTHARRFVVEAAAAQSAAAQPLAD